MLELILRLERAAPDFYPPLLIVPGLIAVLAGLFVWLGGLGLRKILLAIIGTAAGGACGLLIIGQNIIAIAFLAALCAFVAVWFEKIFIAVMAAALVLVLCLAVLAAPYIVLHNDRPTQANQNQSQRRPQPYTFTQTVEIVKAYIADFKVRIKSVYLQMPAYSWILIAAAGIIVIITGLYFARFTCCLCCSGWGTVLIFAGMLLLLFYKGAAPVTHIIEKKSLYAAVFAAMLAFGAIEQLLLCPRGRIKKPLVKQQSDSPAQQAAKKPDWRTE